MAQITIDLDKAKRQATDRLSESELLHVEALHEVLNRLLDIDPGPEHDAEESTGTKPAALSIRQQRRHDAILVDAPRGGGKTTFLVSVLGALERRKHEILKYVIPHGERPHELSEGGVSHKRVQRLENLYSLGIIDPTTVEEKQNIMVMTIERIHQAVTNSPSVDSMSREYERYEDSLRKLAKGVSVLPGVGPDAIHDGSWGDEDYILDKGLEIAGATAAFESNFHDFVENALKVLNNEAFVLALDDVDTWFERGWPVLEALRKYLTTPKLRIILSGDMRLFTLLVRSQQWRQMKADLLKNETWVYENGDHLSNNMNTDRNTLSATHSRMPAIVNTVNRLQDQYLNKVLPPAGHIRLKSLQERAAIQDVFVLQVNHDGYKKKIPLDDAISQYCQNVFGHTGGGRIQRVRDVLYETPLRTILHILAGSGEEILPPDMRAQDENRHELDRDRAIETLVNATWSELQSLNLYPDKLLGDRDVISLLLTLAAWFSDIGDWHTAPKLFPDAHRGEVNLAILAANAAVVQAFVAQPQGIIEYLIKISAVRSIIGRQNVSYHEQEKLIRHLQFHAYEDALTTASRLGSWINEYLYFNGARAIPSLHGIPVAEEGGGRHFLERMLEMRDKRSTKKNNVGEANRIDLLTHIEINAYSISSEHIYDSSRALGIKIQRRNRNLVAIAAVNGQAKRDFEGPSSLNEVADAIVDRPAQMAFCIPSFVISGSGYGRHGAIGWSRLLGFMSPLLKMVSAEGAKDTGNRLESEVSAQLRRAMGEQFFATPSLFEDYGLRTDSESERVRDPRTDSMTSSSADPYVGSDETEGDGDDEGADESGPIYERGDLATALSCWLRGVKFSGEDTASPLTLTRLWERVGPAYGWGLELADESKGRDVADLVDEQIVTFLQACVLSLLDPMGRGMSLDRRGSLGKLHRLAMMAFYRRNPVFPEETPQFQLFDSLFTYPLWGFFLRPYSISLSAVLPIEDISKSKYTRDIYNLYLRRIKARWGDKYYEKVKTGPVKLFSAQVDLGGERPAQFPNLYDVLKLVDTRRFDTR